MNFELFLSPILNFTPDLTYDFMLDFTRLLTLARLIVLKLLDNRVGLIDVFRFGNLDGLFPVNLAVKNPVLLPGLQDPLHNVVHTTETSPSPPPDGVAEL